MIYQYCYNCEFHKLHTITLFLWWRRGPHVSALFFLVMAGVSMDMNLPDKNITGNTDNLFLQKGCVDMHNSFNLYRYGFKLMHTLKWAVLNCFSCCWSFSDGSPLNTSYNDSRDNTELSQILINCTQELFLQCITDALNHWMQNSYIEFQHAT